MAGHLGERAEGAGAQVSISGTMPGRRALQSTHQRRQVWRWKSRAWVECPSQGHRGGREGVVLSMGDSEGKKVRAAEGSRQRTRKLGRQRNSRQDGRNADATEHCASCREGGGCKPGSSQATLVCPSWHSQLPQVSHAPDWCPPGTPGRAQSRHQD